MRFVQQKGETSGLALMRHKGLVMRHKDLAGPETLFLPQGAKLMSDICAGFRPLTAYLAEEITI